MAKDKEIVDIMVKSNVPVLGKATPHEKYLTNDFVKTPKTPKRFKTRITMAQGGVIVENEGLPDVHGYIPISNIAHITFLSEPKTAQDDKQTK